jgi:hypothetical protein
MKTFTVLKIESGRTFSSEVRIDEADVARWASNGRVPPAEAIEDYRIDRLPGFSGPCTDSARETETRAFLAAYRESERNRVYSAEELFEMRAAFGPGARVVNVVTGREIRL